MDTTVADEVFKRLKAQNPNPTTELHYTTPFELLIAVMLSAQATDKSVNKVTASLFQIANTPAAFCKLRLSELETLIQSIGLYRTKAKHILETCHLLIQDHDGHVPNQREALEKLPGVGRKTANVILNTAFGAPTLAVDTHIFRLAHRLGLAAGKTPLQVEQQLLKKISPEYLKDAHHWLILHGRYTCTARNPACQRCILNDLCEKNGVIKSFM